MRTADLTDALLDYWTARAEGVPADQLEIRRGDTCVRRITGTRPEVGELWMAINYTTNWALCGPLLEHHEVALHYLQPTEDYGPCWMANYSSWGDTAPIAICRAVVRAAFGDEVEDFEEVNS